MIEMISKGQLGIDNERWKFAIIKGDVNPIIIIGLCHIEVTDMNNIP